MDADTIALHHTIDDLCRDLAVHRRFRTTALDMLTTALDAARNGDVDVTVEYVDRTLLALRRL